MTHIQRLMKLVDSKNQMVDLNIRHEIQEMSYLSRQILHNVKFKELYLFLYVYLTSLLLCIWYISGYFSVLLCAENGLFLTIFSSNNYDRLHELNIGSPL